MMAEPKEHAAEAQ